VSAEAEATGQASHHAALMSAPLTRWDLEHPGTLDAGDPLTG
jgi:hypothetical protein